MRYDLKLPPNGHDGRYALWKRGPVLAAVISALPCWSVGQVPNQPTFHGSALLDTGSDVTMIQKEFLEALGVQKKSEEGRDTGAGHVSMSLYDGVCLQFSETQFQLFPLDEVLGIPKVRTQYVAIVGRDVLRNFRLIYDGPTGAVSLEATAT